MIWLVLFVISFTNGQDEIPKILMDERDYNGDPAGFMFLKVQTNQPAEVEYKWMKDNIKITKDTQPPFTGYNTETLWVSSPGKQYAGVYQFVMKTKAGTIAGRNNNIDFTYLGEFDPNLPSQVTKDVVIGQAYYLACPKHEPGRHIFYKWGKSSEASGASFMQDKENYIVLDDGFLFFSNVERGDVTQFNKEGWKCAMEAAVEGNSKFKWSEQTITLNVVDTNMTAFGPMIVTKLPQNKTFEEGETISMKCAATGRPTPKYVWSRIDVYGKKHAVESGKDGILYEYFSQILIIKPATRDHAGRYFCTATIGNKSDTVEGSLSFRVKPSWVGQRISSATPSIYDNYTWTCNASGFPEPTYKWFKNNQPVVSSATLQANGGTLTFKRLAKNDSAMYQCVAHNELDNIYQSAYMGVRAEKPVFDSNTGKQTLFLAGKGVIKCEAKAAPAAKNTWSKDGVEIDLSIQRYTLLNNEDLVIDMVSKQDVGNYTCTAKNEFGSDTKKISVQVAGEITFIAEPKDTITTRGSHIKLRCEAKADKQSANKVTIKYKWKFNGKDLPLNGTIVWSSENTLNFIDAKVSQTGDYECIAYIDKPFYAEKKRQAKVIIKGPPESPNKVKIDGDCSAFTAKLLWYITANKYEPIKYFVIQMTTTYEDSIWHNLTERVAANKDETTVTGLSPWAQYRFRVMAINEIGTSPPSEPTVFQDCETPERVPAKCPAIEAIPGKDGELTLKWEEMKQIDRNGRNFQFVLECNSSNPVVSISKTFDANVQEFKIPNAGYYRLWSYKIYGKNRVGPGPDCSGNARSGQDAPNIAPVHLTVKTFGDTFLVLEWKAITLPRGSVDGYKLKYSQVPVSSKTRRSTSGKVCDAKNPCVEDISGGSTTSVRLDGLFPYTKYRITVHGYNSGGAGPESSLSVSTKEGAPELPRDVKLVGYAKYIKLVWKEPARPNGVITAYNVTIHRDANPKWHFSDILDRNARKYVFGELQPEKDYIVSIQAKTIYFGEKSVHVVATKTLQAPAKPGVSVLKGIGENGVNVTFQEGKPEKGFPEKFVVVYRVKDKEGKGNWTQTEPIELYGPNSKPYKEIYGLSKNKEYEVATFAINEKGNSGWSDIQTVVPGSIVVPTAVEAKTTERNNGTDSEAQNTAVHKQSWFVAVVVIVIFLLIVLFVALLITRKRGERYPVGKREKKRAGILDNGEEPDFNTYPLKPPGQNGNGVPRQNSGGSLPNKDPDRDSLDEYGEDRFDEDAASLIGAYNDDRRPHNTADEPEFV